MPPILRILATRYTATAYLTLKLMMLIGDPHMVYWHLRCGQPQAGGVQEGVRICEGFGAGEDSDMSRDAETEMELVRAAAGGHSKFRGPVSSLSGLVLIHDIYHLRFHVVRL